MAPTFQHDDRHRSILPHTDLALGALELAGKLENVELKPKIDLNNNRLVADNSNYSFKFSEIKWRNTILLALFHILALYGQYLYATGVVKWQCAIVGYTFGFLSAFGITAGAHRLWSHRSYKAKWPLRLFLAFCNTVALEMDIYDWCRDHRVHHKFSETNADPHNSNRGFFFAHMGWLMLKKHPDVVEKGKSIDLSDILADPIVRFQRRFYVPLVVLCWGLIPTLIPVYLWNETPWNAFVFCVAFRYVYVLHVTWNVNSAAHIFGHRPYNVHINPRENKAVTYFSFGEGYHNYHHTFPWDYSASEFGFTNNFNLTTLAIDMFAKVGLAYDLKKPKVDIIKGRIERNGDKTQGGNGSLLVTIVDWIFGMFFVGFVFFFSVGLRLVVSGFKWT